MTGRAQTYAEYGGFAALVVGLACLGWALAGLVLAAAFGLLSLAGVLLVIGNA